MVLITKILSKSFFKVISVVSGSNFFSKIELIKKYEFKSREKIDDFQYSQLKKIISEAYENVPFYKERYEKAGIKPEALKNVSDLSKFPIVTKKEIRGEYKRMINKKFKIKNLKYTQSSGSTGEPKIFYFDKEAYGWRLASQFYGWQRAGFEFGDKWLRISMAERNTLFYKLFNFFSRCIYISLTDFNEKKYEKIRLILEKEKPTVIYSYCSALYVLSEYLDSKKYSFDFVKTIIVQGDMCFPKYREKIEKVFKTKVFDTYGGDGVVISGQCEHGSYHIQDTGVIIEIVDDDYNIVRKGVPGRILVTDLHNSAMPLIRYEIADLGKKLDIKCPCGSKFSIMSNPIGRDTDIIKLSNGMSLLVEYFVVLFEYYLDVLQFQVREVGQDTLEIYLKVTDQFSREIEKKIKQELINYCKGGVKVDIKIVQEIALEKSNKRRLVIGRN